MKKLVKKAQVICVFIKNHHASQAIFRRLSPILSICLPIETRFATNFIMIECLIQVCNALEKMVVDADWYTFLSNMRKRSATTYMKCFAVRRFKRSDGFWNTCKFFFVYGHSSCKSPSCISWHCVGNGVGIEGHA